MVSVQARCSQLPCFANTLVYAFTGAPIVLLIYRVPYDTRLVVQSGCQGVLALDSPSR